VRILAEHGQQPSAIAGNLTAWLRSVRPRSYVFIAARVIGSKDHDRVIRFANVAAQVSDAVGVFCFTPVSPTQPTTYKPLPVPPHVELARVLFSACQDLIALNAAQPIEPQSPSPAVLADEIQPENEEG